MVGYIGGRAKRRRRNFILFFALLFFVLIVYYLLPLLKLSDVKPTDNLLPSEQEIISPEIKTTIEELELKLFDKEQKIIFRNKQIEKLRFFSNDIAIGFLTKNIDQKVFDFVDQYHLNGLFPYYKLLNKELIEKLRKKNLMISSWGFENIEDANKLIKLGIDGVTVDWPDEIIVD